MPAVIAAAMMFVISALLQPPGARPAGPQDASQAGLRITDVDFSGVSAVSERALHRLMDTSESSWLPWVRNTAFSQATFEADLKRIAAFYADHGYPRARITPSTRIDRDAGTVAITIDIEEGDPLRIESIALAGFDPVPSDELATLRARIPLAVGKPMVRADVARGAELALHALEEHGYPYARVSVSWTDTPDGNARLKYEATPGRAATFGDIQIAGTRLLEDAQVLREVTFVPGQRYRRSAVQATRREIAELPAVERVEITVANDTTDEQPEGATIRIAITERKAQETGFSLGYGTDERFYGEVRWQHRHVLTGGALSVGGRWSTLDRGVQAAFLQPYFFSRRLSGTFEAYRWRVEALTYRIDTGGGGARVSGRLRRYGSFAAGVSSLWQSSQVSRATLANAALHPDLIALGLNPSTGLQDGRLTVVDATLERSTVDHPAEPSRGYSLSVTGEQAGGWLPGRFSYAGLGLEGRHYAGLAAGRIVLASRLQSGWIGAADQATIPLFKRFFLGGADGLRGWDRFEVTPVSADGLPLGGQSVLQFTSELRVTIAGPIGATVFIDGGQVWAHPWRMRLGDLVYDAGLGLRYRSPIGTLRLDAAYQLTPMTTVRPIGAGSMRRWRVHFSFGEVF